MAYFYFDFRDLSKQTCHDLLRSLVFQLSTQSSPCCDILHRMYKEHKDGTQQPSDVTSKECLKEMLRLLAHGPIFIILDAIDECPDSGFPSSRSEDFQLVKELVDLYLRELYICATSRPEVDIRDVLEPMAFRSVSLHDESGQKADIANYVRNAINLSPSAAMRRWRAEDKNLVIETLTERADGMFRWVFCQLEALQHCFPSDLRQFLGELPMSLDETYDRILKGINNGQQNNAHRLLQCLTIASRPLRVEELAELLAFDFQASSSGGIPKLREDWRWDDQEAAVLSTCSSLIAIVPGGEDSRVVQFSHFSVKEYLTSPRLAKSLDRDVSRFHIALEAAHTMMAQSCLATLLQLDEHTAGSDVNRPPLAKYAAQHWVDHAQFHNVASRIQDGMDDIFDSSKPHFAAWHQVHDIDEDWSNFGPSDYVGTPLYYAAFCGFYDLTERLIMKHPEQVNAPGGRVLALLLATLSKRHFCVADLLYRRGAVVGFQDSWGFTPLQAASDLGQVDIMRWLLDHSADSNACGSTHWTPLHYAADRRQLDAVQVLLRYNADVNLQNGRGKTPLCEALTDRSLLEGKIVDIVRQLLEHGADPNIPGHDHSATLHLASSGGSLEIAQLLLSYGAKVDEKDGKGRTPFQVARSNELKKLLLEYGGHA
ncbi:ankyrin repeat-containing domain protein [Lactarius quietus]|nr:ankyrin repeat-containing domain protein [Lactarius quietus]